MDPRKRFLSLILLMASIVITIEAITITILYKTALTEERARLEETAKSQARMIEAVARFDKVYSNDYPAGSRQATIDQIKDAHTRYLGFGATGEYTLSTRENDQIVFILRHRHADLDKPEPVPWESELAEPMRLALSGRSGTIIGLDYRGEMVLAAFEPVSELDLGIVAKIDLSEIRAPFIRAALISGSLAVVVIGLGAWLFIRITSPIALRVTETVAQLQQALAELKVSENILNNAQKMAHIGSWHYDLKNNRLTWSNEVYRIFGLHPQEFTPTYEKFLEQVHPDDKEMVHRTYSESVSRHRPYEVTHRIVRPDGEIRIVHEKSEDMVDEAGGVIHSFGMVHDITEARKYEAERESLIAELQRSLSEIKTLRGIIPICSFCKKIRDDQGFWDQVEVYLRQHSEASFSHSICPECAAEHYPDFMPKKKIDGGS